MNHFIWGFFPARLSRERALLGTNPELIGERSIGTVDSKAARIFNMYEKRMKFWLCRIPCDIPNYVYA
jgi:hypothetical protein